MFVYSSIKDKGYGNFKFCICWICNVGGFKKIMVMEVLVCLLLALTLVGIKYWLLTLIG